MHVLLAEQVGCVLASAPSYRYHWGPISGIWSAGSVLHLPLCVLCVTLKKELQQKEREAKLLFCSFPLNKWLKCTYMKKRPRSFFCSQIQTSSESNVPVWRCFIVVHILLFPPVLNSPWRTWESVKAVSFWSLSLPAAWVSDVSALYSVTYTQKTMKNQVAFLEKLWLTDLIRSIPYSFSADSLALALEAVWNSLAAQEGGWIARYLFTPHCQSDKWTAVHQSSNIWHTARCSSKLSHINKDQLFRQEHVEKFKGREEPRGNVLIKSIYIEL